MTDGKGRERWEPGENKSRGDRCGGDEPKNVRKPERLVGSLLCRVESTAPYVPYLNPVTYSTFHLPPSLYFFILFLFRPLFITPLHYVSYFSCSHLKLPLDILRPLLFLSISISLLPLLISPPLLPTMSTKGRSTPRVVCCAIPIARAAGKVLVITSRKRPNHWVCESLPLARSTSAFSLIQPSFSKCRKAVGSPQTLHSRLLPRERPGKKVESFVPLPVPPHPDIHFAHCSHCCGFLL
jgi:hypothetical protein